MAEQDAETLGAALGLVVHDLRNPAAALHANMSFVREVAEDPSVDPGEIVEALDDCQQAMRDLMRGLDQLSSIGRWLSGQPLTAAKACDVDETLRSVRDALPQARIELTELGTPTRVNGGEGLTRLLEILVANAAQHSPSKPIRLSAELADGKVHLRVRDGGRAVPEEMREEALTLEGQLASKKRNGGRYGRVLGLFVAKLLADSLCAELQLEGEDGDAQFRLTLPLA